MSENSNELYMKIARIMGRLDRLPKTGYNQHFKYKFVTDADVADTVRNELATENIAFFASMTGYTQEGKHTTATFEYTFVCGTTGERMVLQWTGEANDGQDKGLSKAATSAEKYFLLKTFMLSTGDKADDPDSSDQAAESPQASKTTPKTNGSAPEGTTIADVVWTRDTATVYQFLDWATEFWTMEGEPPPVEPHVINRLCVALGLPSAGGNLQSFYEVMDQYTGTKADAVDAVKTYEPKAERKAKK